MASKTHYLPLSPNKDEADDVMQPLIEITESDAMFLTHWILEGIDFETRWKILQHLHANDGRITFNDLVRLGVYEESDLRTDFWGRTRQRFDIGCPANFPALLEAE